MSRREGRDGKIGTRVSRVVGDEFYSFQGCPTRGQDTLWTTVRRFSEEDKLGVTRETLLNRDEMLLLV